MIPPNESTRETSSHTPIPWEVIGNRICTVAIDEKRVVIAQSRERAFSNAPNAEFIVRACNSHESFRSLLMQIDARPELCRYPWKEMRL